MNTRRSIGLSLLLLPVQTFSAELHFNGVGIASKFQEEYFLAELHAENTSATPELLSENNNLKMKMVITTDSWTKRQFTQHWNQAIFINNSLDDRKEHSQEVSNWLNSIKGSLIKGDQLVLEVIDGNTLAFTLNDVELYQSNNADMATILLNTWIGPRPPSSDFKSGILGLTSLPDEARITAYNTKPKKSRVEHIRSWLTPDEPKKDSEKSNEKNSTLATANKAVKKKDSAKAPGKPLTTTAAATKITAKKTQPTPAKSVATANKPLSVVANNTATADNNKKKTKSTSGNSAPSNVTTASATKALVKPKPKTAPVIAQDSLENSTDQISISQPAKTASKTIAKNDHTVTAGPKPEQHQNQKSAIVEAGIKNTPLASNTKKPQTPAEDPLLKIYRSNILTLTYQNLIYPNSAIDRGQEGKVMLKLTLNRKGKVKNFEYETKSRYKSLNKAVEKAVSLASPYPVPPRKLKGKEITILLPIVFSLSG